MEIHLFMLAEKSKIKVAFIHGRPSGHPIHVSYAQLLNADFFYEDYFIKWLETDASKFKRYLSWLINAVFFPNKARYDVFFCECLRVPPLIMRVLRIMKSNQKMIALMADESLYFLDKNRYPKLTQYLIKLFLKKCDAIICIGDLQYELALKYTDSKLHYKIVKIYNGIDVDYTMKLSDVKRIPEDTIRFLVIANLAADWRVWYKGVDIAIEAFCHIVENNKNAELYIVGEVDKGVKENLLTKISTELAPKIIFTGSVTDLIPVLNSTDICLHVSRGDAFPTSTIECLMAGIPVVVSKDTGTKSLLETIDTKFVVDVDVMQTVDAIQYFINLSDDKKKLLSEQCRKVSSKLNALDARADFYSKFYSLV